MPRKPQYALHDVFESAIPVVLEKGCKGCSMDMLINATDFNRRAFYLEFTNKQSFIDDLLSHYITLHLTPLQRHLQATEDISQAIITYFNAYQTHINKQGCLLIRLIVEAGKEDNDIANQARHYFDNLQLSFIGCIERAVAHQEMSKQVNVESLALKLSCFAQGLAVSNIIQQGDCDALIVIKTLLAELP
jgi:TetR/AcrR family transcriptional repressor of nem operon